MLILFIAARSPAGLQFERVVPRLGIITSEFSPVEQLQNLLLLICIAIFGWIAVRDRLRRPMALAFCTLFAVCFVRELDFFLDFYLVDNLWQVICVTLLAITFVYLGSAIVEPKYFVLVILFLILGWALSKYFHTRTSQFQFKPTNS